MNSLRSFITITPKHGENIEIRYIGEGIDGLHKYSIDSVEGAVIVSVRTGYKLAIVPDDYQPTKEITHASP